MTEFERDYSWRLDTHMTEFTHWMESDPYECFTPREAAEAAFDMWTIAHVQMCVRVTTPSGQQIHYIMTDRGNQRELQRAEEGVHYDRDSP